MAAINELHILYKIARCDVDVSPDVRAVLESKGMNPRLVSSSNGIPRCPYIVGYHGAYIDMEYGTVNLILEYMNAGSLQSLIDEHVMFSVDNAAVLAYSVLTALQTLHENGIVHRDIKPSKLLINTEGIVKLTDFGIAKGTYITTDCYDR
jgi:serine/threonine protein kinase